ncbi:MAG: TlpA family protein disulfide reductase, partial [Nocardioidaceae bacterium]|nr:TlpA family protein disulfide reductase [Nocardioidaceae bacterium]
GAGATPYSGTTGLTIYPPDERIEAPDLQGVTLDGELFALTDLAGRVVVLNVWGSWCSPCRAEAPDLAKLARETADRGVRFVGIDTRDTTAAAQAFVRAFNIPYPSIADPDGQVLLELAGIIPVTAVPSTLVVDRQGNVAAKVVGQVSYATLRGLLEDELARTEDAPSKATSRGSS